MNIIGCVENQILKLLIYYGCLRNSRISEGYLHKNTKRNGVSR